MLHLLPRAGAVGALAALLALGAPSAVLGASAPHRGAKAAPAVGTLTQLPGARGCLVDRTRRARGCTSVRALRGAAPFVGSDAVAVSPDGRNVYVAAATGDAIAVFIRDRRTGALRQRAGAAGCIAAGAADGCARAIGLDEPNAIAVSPDGRTVYATARKSGTVAVFTRDRATGALTQATDGSGCIADAATARCTTGRALAGADTVAVSPDGRSVYVGAFADNAVAVFSRDPSSGALTQPADAAGCIANAATDGCATGLALGAPEGVTVSRDGRSVYVASALSNALVTLARDPATGTLTQAGDGSGCLVMAPLDGCGLGRALSGPNAVAVAPDDATVYVTSVLSGSLTSFARSAPTGALAQQAGPGGCVAATSTDGCAHGRAFSGPEGLAVSPDGASVYVTSFASNAIGVLARDRATGVVSQLSGRAGCLTLKPTSGCARARGLAGVSSIAISPDGRHVYAGAFASSGLAVFARAARH